MIRLALLVCCAGLLFAGTAQAATYYVSPSGNDGAAGTSAAPWRTLAKVNNTQMKPGDSVLLQGGQSFDGPLVPWGSGTKASPVIFGSYGTGQATIWSEENNIVFFHAVNWVTVQNLRLTANGADMHVVVSDPATSSAFVTLRGNTITDTGAFGINSPSFADHDWTIQGNTITETGQTGVTFRGSGFKVIGNVIRDTGLDPSEAAHAIYAKGPTAQVIGNLISHFDSSGVSIRYRDSIVQGNSIDTGLIGVTYFQEPDATGGTSTIAYNRIRDASVCGIYLDGSTVERFVIVNNTIRVSAGNGLNLKKVKQLTLANNVVTGTFDTYAALLRKPAGAYLEKSNLFFPGDGKILLWEGVPRTLDGYRAVTKQGAGDLALDPQLDGSLGPLAGSPVIDAGAFVKGVSYAKSCNGNAFSVCDRAPDVGAVERKATRKRKLKRRRSAPTRA